MLKKKKTIVVLTICLCTVYLTIYYYNDTFPFFSFTNYKGLSYQFLYDSHILYTEGCKIPKFDPFDPSVIEYYKKSGDIHCNGKRYLSVQQNRVILDMAAVQKDYGEKKFTCTYKPIYRNPKNKTSGADDIFEYGNEKTLYFNETLPYEFARVFCRVDKNITYEEFISSTPIKPSVEKRCNKDSKKIIMPNNLNVIVIGIDSISKLNFERHFNLTAEYVRQNLKMFEFYGYMKVADNTFPNLTPMLTGQFIAHYFKKWNRMRYFDDLDFIWKNFSSIGYRTFFAEDAPGMGTYNWLKNGFQYPPTDYFFRPFTLAIEESTWKNESLADCFQAKPEIVALYDYLRSFLTTMGNRPYFSFTWAARLTHGKLNKAGLADKPTFELLRDLNDLGLLNRSLLIFMSDHGIRFGDIRKTFIGKIEERMPFLFLSLPQWFLDSHGELQANLISNRRRLTTPFDIHETLVDVYQMVSKDYSYRRTPYGISLFRDISPYRNCESAYILPHWCVCHDYKKLKLNSAMAIAAAHKLVNNINNITSIHQNCEYLTLESILDARISNPQKDLLRYEKLKVDEFEDTVTFGESSNSYEKIMMTIRTFPGNAEFESTVRKIKDNYKVFDISRINMYGNDGDCVDDANLRKFCFCKVHMDRLVN